ncbi:MAG: alpha/beta hydrolase [Massilia sp.]|nr:MAG: alpha/beta hydrolase [Massilia sp.]
MNRDPSPDREIRQVAGLDVLIEGAGDRTVVMIHGWPDTAALWEPQVAALCGRLRCVRFTLPGFDRRHERRIYGLDEMLSILQQVVDNVCPTRPVTLLLHDWGCVFGYRFAQAYPERVEAILALDVGDAGSKAHVASLSLAGKLGIASYQIALALAWPLPVPQGDAVSRTIARWAKAPSDMRRVGSHMNYPYVVQWSGGYGSLPFEPHCPMLFAYGTRKPFMFHSEAWLAGLKARPDSEVLAFDTGHWVSHEAAAEFNAALLRWLDRNPSTTLAQASKAARSDCAAQSPDGPLEID